MVSWILAVCVKKNTSLPEYNLEILRFLIIVVPLMYIPPLQHSTQTFIFMCYILHFIDCVSAALTHFNVENKAC